MKYSNKAVTTHVTYFSYISACPDMYLFQSQHVVIHFAVVEGQCKLLDINLKGGSLTEDFNLDEIATKLEGYSGAEEGFGQNY